MILLIYDVFDGNDSKKSNGSSDNAANILIHMHTFLSSVILNVGSSSSCPFFFSSRNLLAHLPVRQVPVRLARLFSIVYFS